MGAAHLTLASPATTPRLVFLGTPATPATASLPRDVGPPDPSAAAYVMAAQLGDAVGILASSYLSQKGLMNDTCLILKQKNIKKVFFEKKNNFWEL